jgi:ABC-type uncharacterized transport system permease subunit
MSWFNRMRYPRTDSGRKRYVKDSLKSYQCKIPFLMLILAGIAGMILSLIWCFESKDFNGSWLIALLSLLIFALGIQGIKNRES